MSLGATAQSAPQSAPQPSPAASAPAAASQDAAPGSGTLPAAPAAAAQLGEPKPGSEQIGGNGGPEWNWRAEMAGADDAAVERLARFQQPADVWKSYRELEGKLAKRAEPVRLADDAKLEQIAEFRKSAGIPEVPQDAKPDAYLKAFKIEPPKGYELSEVEGGMLGDFAKLAYEKGHSPREVKAATDFFFAQQQASQQALNRIAVDYMKTSQNALRDELGSKEYDAQQSAGEAWLKAQFKDNPQDMAALLHAQMPNGGKLGDNPWFFKLVAKQAMGDGYTDRIEANVAEASGKSLAQQRDEIEALRRTDVKRYNDPGVQARLDKIISLQLSRGEIDQFGNPTRRTA